MHGDFNQAGHQYETLAVAGDPGHYQMLAGEGAKFFEDLQKHFCSKWAGDLQSSELKRWTATIDCLRSFLYQVRRMADHAKHLCGPIPPLEQMMGLSGMEALADFEALLYFGRSALDRLTFAIAKQTYGQECEKFDKFANVLANYEKKDKRATQARTLVELVLSDFQGILIDGKDGKTGLRSLLAHSRSTGESVTHVFTIHRGADGRVLRFDLELNRIGVLNAAWMLNRSIPFVVLNLVALYSEFNRKLTLMACEPTWQPQCIRLSSFVDSTGKGPRFTTMKTNACAFEIITHHVKEELFSHAQKV
jgi:hypothetical protein